MEIIFNNYICPWCNNMLPSIEPAEGRVEEEVKKAVLLRHEAKCPRLIELKRCKE
jgi:predicted DsbA family dithiol-disulfide isomerase